jgi:opacity protein-like surface antigen
MPISGKPEIGCGDPVFARKDSPLWLLDSRFRGNEQIEGILAPVSSCIEPTGRSRQQNNMGPAHILAAAVVAATLATSASAAEPKPDYALKAKNLDISVILAPTIRTNAALAADSLKEGKAWAAKQRADAKSAMKEVPAAVSASHPWTYERKYEVGSVVASRYISIVRSDYMDTNGAHPNSDVNTVLWDDAQKKRISIRPFFTETADDGPTMRALRAAVIQALKAEKKARGVDDYSGVDWYKELKPSLTRIGAIALTPSTETGKSAGLTFHYPPYAVGPYAEGPYAVFVPFEKFKSYLSTEGSAIFGGQRPKGDADANEN